MKKNTFLILTLMCIMKVTSQVVTSFAGSNYPFEYADGIGSLARFSFPSGICIDDFGNLYVNDYGNFKVRKVTQSAIVTTIAGSTEGYADGLGAEAQFAGQIGICKDGAGNIYIADTSNYKIRKISPSGVVSTFAGSTEGYADGQGMLAKFSAPFGICADTSGNIYVADVNNSCIRKISPSGVVTTFAGSYANIGFLDGQGMSAQFLSPKAICSDNFGNLYVGDGYRIRKISSTGQVTTLAGSSQGYADGNGALAKFDLIMGLCSNAQGYIYVADTFNNLIRKITPTGIVTTLAGNPSDIGGEGAYLDGIGTSARFSNPYGVCVDFSDNIFVADFNNCLIRKISQSNLTTANDDLSLEISLYPNPAQSILNIRLTNNSLLDSIVISDLTGKIVIEKKYNNSQINIESLCSGVYFIDIYSGSHLYHEKFVKY